MQSQDLSKREKAFIIENYQELSAKEIANKLGIKKARVQYCAYVLRLKKRNLAANVDMKRVREILKKYNGKLRIGELFKIANKEIGENYTFDQFYTAMTKEDRCMFFNGQNGNVRRIFIDGNKDNLDADNIFICDAITYRNLNRIGFDENNFDLILNFVQLNNAIAENGFEYIAINTITGEVKKDTSAPKLCKALGFERNAYHKRKSRGKQGGVMVGNWEILRKVQNKEEK